MTALILSIDIGTTTIKAALVTPDGQIINQACAESPLDRPEAGAVEHSPARLVEGILDICGKAIEGHASDVKMIVPSSYQFGLILLDRQNKPLTGISTLLDTRACGSWNSFRSEFRAGDLYMKTGCPQFIQYPLLRLYHLRKTNPGLFERVGKVLSSKDYLVMELCGEILAETSTAAATQMLNAHTLKWDTSILDTVGLSVEQFPLPCDGLATQVNILPSTAARLGLPSPVPFLLGVYDGGALGVGLSGLEKSVGVINLGTSGMLRIPYSSPLLDDAEQMRFQTYHLFRNLYFIGGAVNNGAVPLRWIKDLLGAGSWDELTSLASEVPAGSRGVTFLPYFTGERDWKVGDALSGVIHGLREHHGRAELVRAAMEGVAFSLGLLGKALSENSLMPEELRMGGGCARVKPWVQICSNVLNQPIRLPPIDEPALLGNAILGYTALKEYDSLESAAAAMIARGDWVEPRSDEVTRYNELMARFMKLRQSSVLQETL